MPRNNSEDFRRTTYHESGHALAAHILGRRPSLLQVFDSPREDGAHGQCLARTGLYLNELNPSDPADRKLVGQCVVVALAGPMSEWMYSGDPQVGGEDDRDVALRYLQFLQPGAVDKDLCPYAEIAQNLLKTLWQGVEALVQRLKKNRILSGYQISQILDAGR